MISDFITNNTEKNPPYDKQKNFFQLFLQLLTFSQTSLYKFWTHSNLLNIKNNHLVKDFVTVAISLNIETASAL